MNIPRRPRNLLIVALAAAVLAILGFAVWPWMALTFAIVTAERRPGLLSDVTWNTPGSDRKFERRFARGVPEGQLLSWLQANRFQIDATAHHASRLVSSLPCNEDLEIAWTIDSGGLIEAARAAASEAGCL